jgi:DNA-binding GntR family transcriptional regulator
MAQPPYGSGNARSRTSEIYARIRDEIIRGELAPGCKLKIDILRQRYPIGATPIREALSLLSADGLVERMDQRGFRVAEVSGSEFEELLAMRCWLEERALRQAIQKGGKDWEEAIVIARYRLSRTPRVAPEVNHGDNLEWERCHKTFHFSLVSACGSNTLLRLWNQLYDESSRYRYMARLSTDERPAVYQEHEHIAEAALARDADLAVERIIEHYTRTGELLRATIPAFIESSHARLMAGEAPEDAMSLPTLGLASSRGKAERASPDNEME